jgi:hypothetical protein
MAEYYDLNPFKVDYFTKCSSAYNNERTLYEVVEEEAYNKFAIQSRYYPVSMNKDKVFGEGNNKLVMRSFDFMPYTESGQLPLEARTVSTMGILSPDLFNIHISIRNFNVMSTYNTLGVSGVYPSYSPMIGDIIYFKYNKKFYRVLMVKLETEIFLQGKHTYTLVLEMLRDVNYTFSNELLFASDPIIDINPTNKDAFAINDYIDVEKERVLYKPKTEECPPNDPFNDWVR